MTELSNEADFFRFMERNGPNSDGGKRNYLSWLRYVNELYSPNFDSLTRNVVEEIILQLQRNQPIRNKHTTNSAVSDIQSALIAFVTSEERTPDVATDIQSMLGGIDTTTKTEIETRLGQGRYRSQLIDIWRKCSVTEFDRVDLLIASHIKPWRVSLEKDWYEKLTWCFCCIDYRLHSKPVVKRCDKTLHIVTQHSGHSKI